MHKSAEGARASWPHSLRFPWQQLKTGFSGFSERPLPSHQNIADSSSSLAFAVACHNNSGPQGHSIFLDLRNREVEREEKEKQDKKDKKDEQDRDRAKHAEEKSKKKFDELNQGRVVHHSTKWFKATKVRFYLLMSGWRAMDAWYTKISNEQEKQRKAEQEKNAHGRESQRERARLARLQKSDPAERIEKVKTMWKTHCEKITGRAFDVANSGSRACDIFDVCAVSFFRKVRRADPSHTQHNFSLDIVVLFTIVFDCAGASPKPFGRF